jgi:hypothetical protein
MAQPPQRVIGNGRLAGGPSQRLPLRQRGSSCAYSQIRSNTFVTAVELKVRLKIQGGTEKASEKCTQNVY